MNLHRKSKRSLAIILLLLVALFLWLRPGPQPLLKDSHTTQTNSSAASTSFVDANQSLQTTLQQMNSLLAGSTNLNLKPAASAKGNPAPVPATRTKTTSTETATSTSEAAMILAPPVTTVTTNQSGKTVSRTVCPEVATRDGQIVATNAEFVGISGANLIFRGADQQPFSLAIDKAHSQLLKMLGLDADQIKQAAAQRQQRDREQAEKRHEQKKQADLAAIERLQTTTREMQQRAYDEEARRQTTMDEDLKHKLKEIQKIQDQADAMVPPPQRFYVSHPFDFMSGVNLMGGSADFLAPASSHPVPSPASATRDLPFIGTLRWNRTYPLPFTAGRMGEYGPMRKGYFYNNYYMAPNPNR